MDTKISKASEVKLVGGRLCLDFLNTADWHGTKKPIEYLTNYEELIKWGRHAGMINQNEFTQLENRSKTRETEAKRIHRFSISIRESMLRIFNAVLRKEEPQMEDMVIYNTALSKTMKQIALEEQGGIFQWSWQNKSQSLDWFLRPIIKDAADLLTSELLSRVSRCGDERCGWLFLDTSRNKSRRWCDMKDCGNRAKVKRHYIKSKEL